MAEPKGNGTPTSTGRHRDMRAHHFGDSGEARSAEELRSLNRACGTTERPPTYVIAHKPNRISDVQKALACGANAMIISVAHLDMVTFWRRLE